VRVVDDAIFETPTQRERAGFGAASSGSGSGIPWMPWCTRELLYHPWMYSYKTARSCPQP